MTNESINLKTKRMKPELFCQSCTMPIDDTAMRGTEPDGSRSDKYCKYCYQDGHFTDPGMTLDQMRHVVESQMQKQHLPASLIQQSMEYLPFLERWKTA